MRAIILTEAMLLVSLPATAQTGGDGRSGARQTNAGYAEIVFGERVRTNRAGGSTATRPQARGPVANRNRPSSPPRAN